MSLTREFHSVHQEANLELIYEHPIICDGLSLWMERLLEEELSGEQDSHYLL